MFHEVLPFAPFELDLSSRFFLTVLFPPAQTAGMEPADYDGVWKEAAEKFLRPLLERCFPQVARGIDWDKGWAFLDSELQKIVRDAKLGPQRADKLVKVYRLGGGEEWLLLHLEMQHQKDPKLPLRMYQYQHRIVDRFARPVVGLVVLGDLNPQWRPDVYETKLWGCELRYKYLICKLMDFEQDAAVLEKDPDPAAVIIAAHLAARRTVGKTRLRRWLRWVLTRRLYEHGYSKEQILDLYRLLDWLLTLPKKATLAFREDLVKYEELKRMPYITSNERIGREEGRQAALQENIIEVLEARFGAVPYAWRERLLAVRKESELKRLLRQAALTPDLDKFQKHLPLP